MTITEVWKPVKGYEEYYEVSNQGRVRSIANRKCVHGIDTYSLRRTPLILSQGRNQHGHMHVQLTRNKKRRTELVHRLVAIAFLKKPDGKDYVNHKDYNPKNNCVENLEWCTQKENVLYSLPHMVKPHFCKTNSGEHHVNYRKGKKCYRVNFRVNGKQTEKTFRTFEEAITFRNVIYGEAEAAG